MTLAELTAILPSGEVLRGSVEELIALAARRIIAGDLVALPTETVYGLGANALDENSVQKIYQAKGRPSTNPLIVHLASADQLPLVADLSDIACSQIPGGASSALINQRLERIIPLWPGPLSVILPKHAAVPAEVTASGPTVAIRIPANTIAQKLIIASGCPIAAPSANRSGHISPTSASHVRSSLKENAPLILDAGSCSVGIESTVVNLTGKIVTVLRPGAVTIQQLEELLGEDVKFTEVLSDLLTSQVSPGLSLSHYAPEVQLFNASSPSPFLTPTTTSAQKKIAAISISQMSQKQEQQRRIFNSWIEHDLTYFSLSSSGDLHEAARELFALFHALEKQGFDAIVIEECPQQGIGLALIDRIKRAAAR